MILADKIMEHRKKNGWSQEELAEMLGVSRQSVSKWEGAQAIPDMKKILQMSKLFGVTTDYLLKDEIEDSVLEETVSTDMVSTIQVSMEEANRFLEHNEQTASRVSTGVMLCILSSVPLMFLLSLEKQVYTMLGVIIILLMVSCGVAIFVLQGLKGQSFDYLENSIIDTEYGVSGMVKERKSNYASTHAKLMASGIILCILSSVPLLVTQMMAEWEKNFLEISVGVLLLLIGVGVKLIVLTSIKQEGFEKLLEEGDYSRNNKRTYPLYGVY